MKKLFLALLCLLLIISVVSCNDTSNTNTPDTNDTNNTNDTTNSQPDENTPTQKIDPYKVIIEKYEELLTCKKNNTAIPEASETASSATKAVYELAKKCRTPLDMGYAKKDINGDGTNELIFTESTLDIVAIFTVKNGKVAPLITREDINFLIWLDENGLIRMRQFIMEGQYITARKYLVYEISDGNLKERIAIGCDAMEQGDWHKLEGDQKISVSKEEWDALYSQYDICPLAWDEREYTKNYAGLTVASFFEAATPEVTSYMLTSIIKDDRVEISSVSTESVSFTMFYSKYSESDLIFETEITASALHNDGKYLFDNGTVKGSIEFGRDSVWVNIDESTNEHIDCRSYLFDYMRSN
ncbi:MAG: hypothetical protein E7679_05630 [Ruminococcaceae bacterium]|nr:hypothetical protein [Oscillospiraceae bacterium]